MIERLDIELDELLGVYALDATDGDETADVDRYLQRNPRARAEVQGYREVAALLANAGSTAPTDLWSSIVSALDEPAPPLQFNGFTRADRIRGDHTRSEARVIPISAAPSRRRKSGWFAAAAVGAIAAAVISLLAVKVNNQDRKLQALDVAMRGDTLENAATMAMSEPGAHTVTLKSSNPFSGAADAVAVMRPSGESYLMCGQLPKIESGMTYQLWGRAGGKTVSLGVLSPSNHVMAFSVPAGIDEMVVTLEQAPGATNMGDHAVVSATF